MLNQVPAYCAFRPSAHGMLGPGVYVSRDIAKTRNYGNVVFKLLVFTGKVKVVTEQGDPEQYCWQTQVTKIMP